MDVIQLINEYGDLLNICYSAMNGSVMAPAQATICDNTSDMCTYLFTGKNPEDYNHRDDNISHITISGSYQKYIKTILDNIDKYGFVMVNLGMTKLLHLMHSFVIVRINNTYHMIQSFVNEYNPRSVELDRELLEQLIVSIHVIYPGDDEKTFNSFYESLFHISPEKYKDVNVSNFANFVAMRDKRKLQDPEKYADHGYTNIYYIFFELDPRDREKDIISRGYDKIKNYDPILAEHIKSKIL